MKKTLAIILTLALVICMMPASAFAADSQEPLGSDVKITLANYTYTYDGTEKEPAVQSVVVDNQILTQGGDYNVTYNSNINAGIAEVVITGIGNYARKVSTQTFTINSLDLSKDITVTMPTEATYNAAKQTPAYSVKVNDSKVELSKSLYKVTWTPNEDFTAAGSYTATFQPETNDSNIINSKTATYTIKKFDLSGLQIAIDSVAQLPKNQSDLVIHYYLNGTEVDAAKKAIIENAFNINYDRTTGKVTFTPKNDVTANYKNVPTVQSITVKTVAALNVKLTRKNTSIELSKESNKYVVDAGTYDGVPRELKSLFDVYVGSKQLIVDKDYTLSCANTTDAGDYEINITAKEGSGYAGKATATLRISQKDASKVNVAYTAGAQTTATMNTDKAEPKVTDTVNGKTVTLTKGKDYRIDNAVKTSTANRYQRKLTFEGNYTGTRYIEFDVVTSEYDVARFYTKILWKPNNAQYNGLAQGVKVGVYSDYSNANAIDTRYYNVKYRYTDKNGKTVTVSSPKDAQTYTVFIEGVYPYAGTKNVGTYTIAKYPFTSVTFTATGTATAPVVTATATGVTGSFIKGTDFTVGIPISSGTTASVAVRSDGTGNLTSGYKSVSYALGYRYIYNCTVNFSDYRNSSAYTGRAITPEVVVRDSSLNEPLVKGVDYTVTYKNSAGKTVSSLVDAGAYTVVITGRGAYSGSQTLTYTITGTDIGNYTVTLKESSVTADGRTKTPVITSVSYGYYSKLSSSDYTVSYQDSTGKEVKSYQMSAPGTYKVVVTGKNGYTGSCYATFTIVGLSQSITGVDGSYKVYPTSETFRLYPKATEGRFTYTSSDPSVASVDAFGNVTPYKAGRAKITISTTGNVRYNPVTTSTVIKVYPNKAAMTRKPWTAGKGKIKARWNKQDNVTRYEVRYSKNKSFKKGTYKTKKVNAAVNAYTTQSTTLSGLNSGYTYYVKVRAVKEVYNDYGKKLTYYGKWSGWKSVRVK